MFYGGRVIFTLPPILYYPMAKVKTDEKGRLILPDAFLQRRHISSNTQYWLDEWEGDLILHPRLPDVRDCLWAQDIVR